MEKPRLSILTIINMSIGFMGIQFGWGLQMANMSAIYSYLGANPDQIPILWLAAPLTGLIVQPIIGHLSDNTWSPRLGRRRPFFLTGAILATIALIGMPYSGCLLMAAGFLWVLDASVNISMEPFRAFVADMLPDEQRTVGYSVQTLFVSIGAVVASAFPWLLTNVFHISSGEGTKTVTQAATLFADRLPYIIKISFHVGAAVFIICVLWTIFTVKEYPPENLEEFMAKKKKERNAGKFFKEIITDIKNMPIPMRQLSWVQFFTWTGLFLMWLYFGISVGELFGKTGTPEYLAGIEWAGLCFAGYNFVSLIYSFFMPAIAKRITRKWTHILSLLFGAACMMAVIIPSQGGNITTLKIFVMSVTIGIGVAWGSILTMPYAILSTSIPQEKMGFYMGVFNFFITIPQILTSLFFGWILLHVFHDASQWGVACGGFSWILAAIMMLRVKENK